ncbi:MAG TPA: nuclear transport factor 2 family protein [Thermoanaerobaculia bacterium]|nr:nuclear transport factor 2 family protein [Thermoanaerobaculia bacterium]
MANTAEESENLARIERYFAVINSGGDVVEEFFSPDVIQEEFPNRLLPNGARRDLAALKEAAERGKAFMSGQHFEVLNTYADGRTVIVESIWTGTVAVDAGPFKAGTTMRARFAQFFTFAEGRIVEIRNYDCFDPW